MILAIDPGTTQSGCVLVQDGKIIFSDVMANAELLYQIESKHGWDAIDLVAIEWIQSMGMKVGKEVFETCMWVGRFAQAANCPVRLIPRGKIKLHHCGQSRAKDGNVVQSLKDKYGNKGTKANPGYFYGMKSHAWQAFAVAAYVIEGAKDENEILINAGAVTPGENGKPLE